MKEGDLVTVGPSKKGIYLVVEKDFCSDEDGQCWVLYGHDSFENTFFQLPMAEKWVELISEV